MLPRPRKRRPSATNGYNLRTHLHNRLQHKPLCCPPLFAYAFA
ncbi:hypothetical protein [Pseudomonas syringae]